MERLKQKVASSSSRVLASLQQVAATTSGPSQAASQQQQQHQAQQISTCEQQASQLTDNQQQPPAAPAMPEAAMSTAWLMAADATAHLTDEEKGILFEVFKKEEQFQRDTIKQLTAARAQQQQQQRQLNDSNKENNNNNRPAGKSRGVRGRELGQASQSHNQRQFQSSGADGLPRSIDSSATPTCSSTPSSRACSCATQSCGHATPTMHAPSADRQDSPARRQAPNLQDTQAAGAYQPQDFGPCRICRKTIGPSEPCHLCSNCNQFICDDCASYSAIDQHWMCSSCRRRAMNPPIPVEALKELGLNQNSSAVRRMTLRLNQSDFKAAVNKCPSESSSSNLCAAGQSQAGQPTAAASAGSRSLSSLKSQKSPHQVQAVRPTSSGSGGGSADGSPKRSLSKQNSLARQQQLQLQAAAAASGSPIRTPSVMQRQREQSVSEGGGGNKFAQQQPPRQTPHGSGSATPSALTRVNSLQQKSGAHKTMSQPTDGAQTRTAHPLHATSSQMQRQQPQAWSAEPEAKRAAQPVRHDSLGLRPQTHQQEVRRASVAAPVSPVRQQQQQQPQQQHNQWPPQQPSQVHYTRQPAVLPLDHQDQQLMGGAIDNRRSSIVFGAQHPHLAYHSQQQAQMPVHPQFQMTGGMHHDPNCHGSDSLGPSPASLSRRGSYNQHAVPPPTQLIPIPPEQMHLRRLSDQSNLVRRSSIIASNFLDGASMARNRSHSNIDTVHYLYQHQQQQQQQQQQQGGVGMFVSPRGSQHLHLHHQYQQQPIEHQNHQHHQSQQYLGQHAPAAACSSSTANLFYLQPNQPAQLSQRRLSDGGQYFAHADGTQSARDYQQLSSIVTSCAQKHHSGGHVPHHRRQSSEDIHSDSSSDIGEPVGALGAGGYAAMDYQDDNYHMQQPINIPSVSVSEFAAAAAARRSSIQQQQQQQQQDSMMAHYAQDNQITPMQINVAIEQVIRQQQQQQQQQNQLGPDNQQLAYLMRRGSSGRVLPSIPGGQSRSLLELPHQGEGQTDGDQQQSSAHDRATDGLIQNGANTHGHNGWTPGMGQTTLDLPCTSPTLRRASAPEGQNIKIVVDDIDNSPFVGRAQNGALKLNNQLPFDPAHGQQMGNFYERHILYRDDSLDPAGTHVGRGFGLQVTGGKLEPAGKLQARVTWVLPGGPADKVGLRAGDKIIEWDGKCLLDMSYEQVAEVIESSANIAELLVKPAPQRLSDPDRPPASYVRSHRRLSQQTERDLRRHQQQQQQSVVGQQQVVVDSQQRRMSTAQMNGSSGGGGGAHGSERVGTGRRLPQIPQAVAKSSEHTNRLGLASSGAGTERHASTSQLDQPLTTSTSNLIYSQAAAAAGSGGRQFLAHSGNHLNTFHQTHEQQQTRSANELNHRGSMVALSYQQQASLIAGCAGSQPTATSDHLAAAAAAGGWAMQQYGGSQQIVPTAGGQTFQMTTGGYGHNIQHNNTAASLSAGQPQEISGLIGLQVTVDERLATLEISILSAHNIDRDPSQDYVVRVRILPDGERFKVCTTQPSADMNWKETFIFQSFPIHKVQRMALEIGIWVHDEAPRLSAHMAQPLCEALIPIQSARERNIDFWPLRPPPTSPQARRKSLNDLIGNHYQGPTGVDPPANDQFAYRQTTFTMPGASGQVPPGSLMSAQTTTVTTANGAYEASKRLVSPFGSQARVSSVGLNSDSPVNRGQYQRERSSSNRNLQDTSKLHVQPRRASDEVATSSSHRLLTRLSPAASRRSISVMNVGDGFGHAHAGGQSTRSPSSKSRPGSQANILKAAQLIRRDSTSQFQAAQAQQRDSPASGSPIKHASGGQQAGHGYTQSGRRTSVVGMQSLVGYSSQKSSLSDATDHESPLNCGKRTREGSLVPQPTNASGKPTTIGQTSSAQVARATASAQQPRQVSSGPTSARPSCSSNSNSRRGSTEQSSPAQLQRRGSFATQTLRKLKRTLSLNKGSDTSQPGSNQESRRSSSSSDKSHSGSVGEDLAIARPIRPSDTLVGRLKLSFIMTKGQFEVEVICGQGLRFDLDSATGIYVKLYLRGKNRSNKRRTRVVQPWEAPLFKQTIRYDASLVDNKLLEVSIWLKQRNYRSKQALGTADINLADLDLTRLQTSWYNLRSIDNLSSSSVDE